MAQATYTHSFNSRAYTTYYSISKKSLEEMQRVLKDPHVDSLLFSKEESKLICFDYAFAAWENFLEHIGYNLFEDWDSGGKQRHYLKKFDRLMDLTDCIYSNGSPVQANQIQQLNMQWNCIIKIIDPNSPDFKDLLEKRNPIKHIHSGRHESKTIVESKMNFPHGNPNISAQLTAETYLGINEADCSELVKKIESLIVKAHQFLKNNEKIFKISYENPSIEDRASLWDVFMASPWSQTFFSCHTALDS